MNSIKGISKYEAGYYAGFPLKEYPCCAICRNQMSDENNTCVTCQRAIDRKIIPAYLTRFRTGHYTSEELILHFKLSPELIEVFMDTGLLKGRVIPAIENGKTYSKIFLLKENKDFLPPHKKLRRGKTIQQVNATGELEFVYYPWYHFVKPIEYLAEYGISDFITNNL